MKRCGTCGVNKPKNHFYNDKEEFCIQCFRQPKQQREIKKPKTYSELKAQAIVNGDITEDDHDTVRPKDFY